MTSFERSFGAAPGSLLDDVRRKRSHSSAPATPEPTGPEPTGPEPTGPETAAAPRPKRRLPPGQSLAKRWPVLDLGEKPLIEPARWELRLSGAVDRPMVLDWACFNSAPRTTIEADIHCVTGWSCLDMRFGGVAAARLAELARPRPSVRFVTLRGYDGYATSVPLARFLDPHALFATDCGGEPLDRDHGGPVRFVLPTLYFWKSAKWVRTVTFLEHDVRGTWEAQGYHPLGDPWKEQRSG